MSYYDRLRAYYTKDCKIVIKFDYKLNTVKKLSYDKFSCKKFFRRNDPLPH